MQQPLRITFREMESSPAIESDIRAKAEALDRFADDIIGCHVVVEAPHRHHHRGRVYHVRLDIKVSGAEIVVSRDPAEHHAHEDVYVAIRDAFDAARRRLEDHARRKRGVVKAHADPAHARVQRLFSAEGYGFLATADGREIFFHENSVRNGGFAALRVGGEVRFVEEVGEQGPQASTVTPL